MRIKRTATSGSLESSDLFVEVSPNEATIDVSIDSVVKRQFGDQIEFSIREVAQKLGVKNAKIYVSDRGALDCTIRARVESAILRAGEEQLQ